MLVRVTEKVEIADYPGGTRVIEKNTDIDLLETFARRLMEKKVAHQISREEHMRNPNGGSKKVAGATLPKPKEEPAG